ncbi:kinesin light chain [Trichonephila clavipes]|nr:kinesin light chain [Trichonephila clavipes]
MFSGAKMRLLKWREKKHPNWKTEILRPTLDRDKIVDETKNAMKYLENLHDEYKRILDQLLEQLPTLSECGDDKNSLIKQKVDFLKKNLIVIERGLADSQDADNMNADMHLGCGMQGAIRKKFGRAMITDEAYSQPHKIFGHCTYGELTRTKGTDSGY